MDAVFAEAVLSYSQERLSNDKRAFTQYSGWRQEGEQMGE